MASQAIRLIAQLGTMAVLARLLVPDDFGVVAMLASAFALLELVRDMGFNSAIVQRAEVSQSQLVKIFWISAIVGVSISCLAVGVGGFISWFANDPRIMVVAPVLSLTFFVNSLATVPAGLLKRRLQFRVLAIRELGSYVISAAVGVLVAWLGGGVWTLVAMPLAAGVSSLAFVWFSAKWLPLGPGAPLKELFQFLKLGGAFTLGEFANYISSNLDNLLIGKFWGMQSLGFYARGYALMLAPVSQVMGPLGAVILPVLCRIQSDEAKVAQLSKRLAILFNALGAGLAVFVMLGAAAVVTIVLGPGWDESIEIIRWFSLLIFTRPLTALLYWVTVAQGRTEIFVKWATLNCVVNVLAILCGLPFGALGVAMSLGVSSLLFVLPLAISLAASATRLSFKFWSALCLRSVAAVALVAIVSYSFGLFEYSGLEFLEMMYWIAFSGALAVAVSAVLVFSYLDYREMVGCFLRRKFS